MSHCPIRPHISLCDKGTALSWFCFSERISLSRMSVVDTWKATWTVIMGYVCIGAFDGFQKFSVLHHWLYLYNGTDCSLEWVHTLSMTMQATLENILGNPARVCTGVPEPQYFRSSHPSLTTVRGGIRTLGACAAGNIVQKEFSQLLGKATLVHFCCPSIDASCHFRLSYVPLSGLHLLL